MIRIGFRPSSNGGFVESVAAAPKEVEVIIVASKSFFIYNLIIGTSTN